MLISNSFPTFIFYKQILKDMKRFLLPLAIVFFMGCQPGEDATQDKPTTQNPPPASADPNTVTIGDRIYKTVTIGNQIWTAENYNGVGENRPSLPLNYVLTPGEKLYTKEESQKIVLPAGWRIPSTTDYFFLSKTIESERIKLLNKDQWPHLLDERDTLGFNIYPTIRNGHSGYSVHYMIKDPTKYRVLTIRSDYGSRVPLFSVYDDASFTLKVYTLRFVKDK